MNRIFVRLVAISACCVSGAAAIGERMYRALRSGKKAEFALDVIETKKFDDIVVPRYIAEGLEWLLAQLKKKQVEILPRAGQTRS